MAMSTVHAVSCDAAIEAGKVCAHAVTTKQLLDWGIDCEIVLGHLHVPGQARHKAVYQAWQRGLVRMCTLDPASTGRPWLTPRVQSPESVADVLAFAAASKWVSA